MGKTTSMNGIHITSRSLTHWNGYEEERWWLAKRAVSFQRSRQSNQPPSKIPSQQRARIKTSVGNIQTSVKEVQASKNHRLLSFDFCC